MRTRRTAYGSAPLHAWQRAGFGALGAGGAVMVTSPGAPAPTPLSTGGARMPEALGADIAAREGAMAHAETSDSPCTTEWTVLLFPVPCDRMLTLVYADIYAEAQRALAALASGPDPTAAADRVAFVGLVGAYGWVMTWAAGVLGRCLPLDAAQGAPAFNWYTAPYGDPSQPVDSTHHYSAGGYTLPGTGLTVSPGLGFVWSAGTHSATANARRALDISLTQLNRNRCKPGVWTGASDGGKPRTTVIGADPRWGTSEGIARTHAAREVARQLSTYTVIDLWADAFQAYLGKLNEWQASGVSINVDATTGNAIAQHLEDKRGAQTADAAAIAVGSAAVLAAAVNPIAGALVGIVAGIIKLFSFLPPASGGIPCPYPFLFRTVLDPACTAATSAEGGARRAAESYAPTIATLMQQQAQARAAQLTEREALLARYKTAAPAKKLSPVVTIGGSAVGIGILVFIIRTVLRRRG